MAKLSARGRRRIASKNFALPGKRLYPIHDRGHAKAALREAARPNTRGSYETVRRAVCAKYPGMGQCRNGGKKGTGGKK